MDRTANKILKKPEYRSLGIGRGDTLYLQTRDERFFGLTGPSYCVVTPMFEHRFARRTNAKIK